jgi:hypothetical protein
MVGRAKRLALLAALGATFGFAYACTVTDDLLLVSGKKEPGCKTARPPAPPGATPSSNDGGTIQVAAIAVSTGSPEQKLGFDLDESCTCLPDEATCKPHFGTKACDDDAGRDNAVAGLFESLKSLNPDFDEIRRLNQILGVERGVLFEVSQYNGEPDDEQVTLAIYGSNGLVVDGGTTKDGGVSDAGDAGTMEAPAWTIDRTSLSGPKSSPLNSDLLAYVRGGTLVAQYPTGLALDLEVNLNMKLSRAVVVGKLAKNGNRTTLTEVVLAGHWEADEIYRSIRGATFKKVPVCNIELYNPTITRTVCAALDLPAAAGNNSNDFCRAGSIALRFTTAPARFDRSTVVPSNVVPYTCPDASLKCE